MRGKAGMFSRRNTSDTDFSSVSLLLHMDGSNGATTFTDSSGTPKTVTANGGAAISTAQSKFGGASGLFGDPKRLEIADDADFNLSSTDFTIEAWIYCLDLAADNAIVSKDSYGDSFSWGVYVSSTKVDFACNGFGTVVSGVETVTENEWHHVAVTSSGGTVRVFLDGISLISQAATVTDSSSNVSVGCFSSNNPNAFFDGYIDDLRITKGVARYTANFTPPTAAFPDS